MKQIIPIALMFVLFYYGSSAQLHSTHEAELKSNQNTELPYNRIIHSAGKVITYGDSSVENHVLDICLTPDKNFLIVEDRYGIAVLNSTNNTLVYRWRFSDSHKYNSYISTYSGICSFIFHDSTYIAWGASGGKSAIMLAVWDGKNITSMSAIPVQKKFPADVALPNQIVPNTENGILYLYAVLNGNNQLLKIRMEDQKTIWSAPTGVAPYGITIVGNNAYVTNWAGPLVTDSTKENAGTPWGSAYTNPITGGTKEGSLSVIDISTGSLKNEYSLGLHPNAIVQSPDHKFIYVANGSSDDITIIDAVSEKLIGSINVGLFSKETTNYYGSSPNALLVDDTGTILYVANGMDNAVAVVNLGAAFSTKGLGKAFVKGFIPTEAYPSGLVQYNQQLYVTNLEAKGARILSDATELKQPNGFIPKAYEIHAELTSVSIIPIPSTDVLLSYTEQVKKMNLVYRVALTNQPPRKGVLPKPVPDRIGEPSVFKHVIYIIKENKTFDQVYGDVKGARGDKDLCVYGATVTPNQHKLASDFSLLDNYYASGKSSAEGHQWVDAAMVSDYVEKNVRAWFRSYPHRQEDALVYNKNGFIWNNALDHGKKVRIYGEACLTKYNSKLNWLDIYNQYMNHQPLGFKNTTTIARIRPIISPEYPDCDNIVFTDQIRADVFIKEWKQYEQQAGDQLPALMVLSLPNDHTGGSSPSLPTPNAMVADNDLAVGRIIETISHSRFWDSTVVFITQDDSQSGWDHISPYRTTAAVISPYSSLHKIIHTNYNQVSMVRTIEQILGIPPMNVMDATASPMVDCFSNSKTNYTYQLVPNQVPLNEMNKPISLLKGKAKYFAKLSAAKVFKEVDGGNDNEMNQILWFAAKGDVKYPTFK